LATLETARAAPDCGLIRFTGFVSLPASPGRLKGWGGVTAVPSLAGRQELVKARGILSLVGHL